MLIFDFLLQLIVLFFSLILMAIILNTLKKIFKIGGRHQ